MVDEPAPDLQAELDEALFALEELIADSPQEALSMYESLPEEVRARPEFKLSKARALQANQQLADARALCEAVLVEASDPALAADTHHLLADLLEDLGDLDAANEHFVHVLKLDRSLYPQQRHLSDTELTARVRTLLERVVERLPEATRQSVGDVRVELFPSEAEVRAGLDPRAFSALTDTNGSCFKVFAANLDAEYGDLDELGEFDEHVEHELGHQLGEQLGP